jgi:Gas vesicle protein
MTEGYQHEAVLLPAPQQPGSPARGSRVLRYERIALVDLLDRLLAGGVVISGEVRLAIADVDLVNVSLRALISSVSSVVAHGPAGRRDDS